MEEEVFFKAWPYIDKMAVNFVWRDIKGKLYRMEDITDSHLLAIIGFQENRLIQLYKYTNEKSKAYPYNDLKNRLLLSIDLFIKEAQKRKLIKRRK